MIEYASKLEKDLTNKNKMKPKNKQTNFISRVEGRGKIKNNDQLQTKLEKYNGKGLQFQTKCWSQMPNMWKESEQPLSD